MFCKNQLLITFLVQLKLFPNLNTILYKAPGINFTKYTLLQNKPYMTTAHVSKYTE